jgi:hypothetical protein
VLIFDLMFVRVAVTAFFICFFHLGCGDSREDHDDGHEHDDGGDGGKGGAEAAADKCCELGAICHVVGDNVDAEVEACHELGHENNADACADDYERCLAICQGANDSPIEHACE